MKTLALRFLHSENGNSMAEQAMVIGLVGTGTTVMFGRVTVLLLNAVHALTHAGSLVGWLQ